MSRQKVVNLVLLWFDVCQTCRFLVPHILTRSNYLLKAASLCMRGQWFILIHVTVKLSTQNPRKMCVNHLKITFAHVTGHLPRKILSPTCWFIPLVEGSKIIGSACCPKPNQCEHAQCGRGTWENRQGIVQVLYDFKSSFSPQPINEKNKTAPYPTRINIPYHVWPEFVAIATLIK